jgi:SAM-dependent methyltransferase
MNLRDRIQHYWETTETRNAHFGIDGERQELSDRFKSIFKDIEVKDKTVIDFGCGGGLLGVYLEKRDIKKYIAYDVSIRSIEQAKKNLKEYSNIEFNHLEKHIWDFAEKKPDILCAIAVMIHFPSAEYLDNFLSSANTSGAKRLILEIRDMGMGVRFQDVPYTDHGSVIWSCVCTKEYLSERLPGYKLVKYTDPTNKEESPTNCQLLWYEKNDSGNLRRRSPDNH